MSMTTEVRAYGGYSKWVGFSAACRVGDMMAPTLQYVVYDGLSPWCFLDDLGSVLG